MVCLMLSWVWLFWREPTKFCRGCVFSAVMSVGFAVTFFYVDVLSLVVAVTPVGHRNLLSILEYNHF